MTKDDFENLLKRYGDPPARRLNPTYANVDIVIHAEVAEKIRGKHGFTADDVRAAIQKEPPPVVERRHKQEAKVQFWGETDFGDSLYVVCLDGEHDGRRVLVVITAFGPDDERDYWERQRR